MEGGATGVTGMTVRCLVEGQIKVELECVTLLHPNLEEMIAQLMDHQIRKHKDAMKILVQVKTILFLANDNNLYL